MTDKLEKLADERDMEIDEFISDVSLDTSVPGICINPDCDHMEMVDKDCNAGWCPNCQTNTVQSCLVIAGIT